MRGGVNDKLAPPQSIFIKRAPRGCSTTISIKSTSARLEFNSLENYVLMFQETVYWTPFSGEIISKTKLVTVLTLISVDGRIIPVT